MPLARCRASKFTKETSHPEHASIFAPGMRYLDYGISGAGRQLEDAKMEYILKQEALRNVLVNFH
jgi:hypothetical protein